MIIFSHRFLLARVSSQKHSLKSMFFTSRAYLGWPLIHVAKLWNTIGISFDLNIVILCVKMSCVTRALTCLFSVFLAIKCLSVYFLWRRTCSMCHRYRSGCKMIVFLSILNTFIENVAFRVHWGSGKNCLELKI